MPSLRSQKPTGSSDIVRLKTKLRDLRVKHKPYVDFKMLDDSALISVGFGKKIVNVTVWFGDGKYRFNASLPMWAYNAAPNVTDDNARSIKTYRSDQSQQVRVAMSEEDLFNQELDNFIGRIISNLSGSSGKTEAPTAPKAQEKYDPFGDGPGQYLAVQTTGSKKFKTIEALGPVLSDMETVEINESWEPLFLVNATCREDALKQIHKKTSESLNENQQSSISFGTIKILESNSNVKKNSHLRG